MVISFILTTQRQSRRTIPLGETGTGRYREGDIERNQKKVKSKNTLRSHLMTMIHRSAQHDVAECILRVREIGRAKESLRYEILRCDDHALGGRKV